MNWWRAHHGISNDVKVGIVAAKINATKAEVGWILIILLDYASQNDDRGSVEGLEPDEIAAMSGITPERAAQIVNALRERKIITPNNRLTNWEKRQFDGDYSTARVRKFRSKKRNETNETAAPFHETPETSEQNRTEQSRTEGEQTRVAAQRPPAPVLEMPKVDYHERYERLYARHPVPGYKNIGQVKYLEILSSSVNPETVADAIDREHVAWCNFWEANPTERKPGIGYYFEDGWYMRQPSRARDSPPPAPKRLDPVAIAKQRAEQMKQDGIR